MVYRLAPRSKLWSDAEQCYGRHCGAKLEIEYQEDLPPRLLADTILHECVHAFAFVYGWKSPDFREEQMALRIPPAMTAMFNDNPDFVKWWNWARLA